jgi:hypothetical protein
MAHNYGGIGAGAFAALGGGAPIALTSEGNDMQGGGGGGRLFFESPPASNNPLGGGGHEEPFANARYQAAMHA